MIVKSPLAPLFQRGEFVFVLLFALSYLFGATQSADAQSLKKIRIASKGGGETLLPYLIPQRLGFYKEEGLDVDVIVTRGTVTTQVVVSGAVDYSNGGSIPAVLGVAQHAQTKGFRVLAYSGDYVSALSANLESTDDKIQNAPDEVL
jgi:ABC-type nitrate/sulfonate/bicarbonate transport system substrate-binding protein